jgi:hypothetical protein
MAWFSGKVSLGGFPDLTGAVNKFQESVKNIEKNFDNALGFDDKSDSAAEGVLFFSLFFQSIHIILSSFPIICC